MPREAGPGDHEGKQSLDKPKGCGLPPVKDTRAGVKFRLSRPAPTFQTNDSIHFTDIDCIFADFQREYDHDTMRPAW